MKIHNRFYYYLFRNRFWILGLGIPITNIVFTKIAHGAPLWSITSPFGEVDGSVHATPHKGLDIAVVSGTPIDSLSDGTVIKVQDAGDLSWGKSIHIQSGNKEYIYGHLSDFKVEVGQEIHQGDLIALSGNSGRSTGAHLDITIKVNGKPIDPLPEVIRAALGRHDN